MSRALNERPDTSTLAQRHLLSIDDLDDSEVTWLLERASAMWSGGYERLPEPRIVGSVFLSSSLRTRTGFAVAAQRLGASVVEAHELRWEEGMSAAETVGDTLRTITGITDTVVMRAPSGVALRSLVPSFAAPVVNAGDADEHPTQALIDHLALESERGPVSSLRMAMCGDLRMRSVRSSLKLLNRFPPAALILIAPHERSDFGVELSPILTGRTEVRDTMDIDDVDVLSMIGLPEGAGDRYLPSSRRRDFALTPERLATLPEDAVVLSPLPVIDEIEPTARHDLRIRMFVQSDRAVAMRMAILERSLATSSAHSEQSFE